ncbi:MAG: hypothetical protein ACR2QT_12850 [Woeseiaceae bacterium]
MRRMIELILLATVFGSPAWGQEDDADGSAEDEQAEESPVIEEVTEPVVDEPIVDDEFYQDVDDEDFRPSEDIPADQSIPFPSDI